jgi:hypothetical protein
MPYKDKNKAIEWGNRYREAHKDRILNRIKEYRISHKEKMKKYNKIYRKSHPRTAEDIGGWSSREKKNAYQRKYFKDHPDKKEKAGERRKIWAQKNQDRIRRNVYKRVYGITLEEYNRLHELQGGLCALCGNPECDSRKKWLAVDHNHESGRVRKLLCTTCNTRLGWYEVNKNKIDEYLQKG